jgi:hypothetical protein
VKYAQLYHGAVTWDRYLRKGLDLNETGKLSAWLALGEPRRWFMASGTDSHGDFNYSRYGELCRDEWCESSVGDTAIGSPRNLLLVGPPTGPDIPGEHDHRIHRYTNAQVISAIKGGTFSVTDGPALRIAIDRNRDGKLSDDRDYAMGSTFELFPNEQIPVLVEWISSPEFGAVKKIDVYVGTQERTYAPEGHGPPYTLVVDSPPPQLAHHPAYATPAYSHQASSVLSINLSSSPSNIRYHGMAKVYLNPADFGITQTDGKLFYVRTYAQIYGRTNNLSGCTIGPLAVGKCGDRHAYSNPVWGRYNGSCSPQRIGLRGRRSIDGNNDNVPDTCGGVPLPDLCAPNKALVPPLRSCNVVSEP